MILDRRSLLRSALALPLVPLATHAATGESAHAREQIGMLIYPGFTALDFVGPHHFLANLPGADIHVVTTQDELTPVISDLGLTITPTTTMAACPQDLTVLFIPGGMAGTIRAARDHRVLRFVADRSARCSYITSVCTGSLILGAAGVLVGKHATSHWATLPALPQFGALPVHQRVVRDGNLITGAGVSAGIDFGITLAEELGGRLYAEAGVLISEYAPEPPILGGTVETARPEVVALLHRNLASFVSEAVQLEMLK